MPRRPDHARSCCSHCWRHGPRGPPGQPAIAAAAGAGVLLPVAWTGLKVGALSFGGGFVIIPLMQADATSHHWMTHAQFLNGVALGQVTPGPVVQTVATVGYAAAGIGGGLLAAVIAFFPSFAFVLAGARHFGTLRGSRLVQDFFGSGRPCPRSARFSVPPSCSPAHCLSPGSTPCSPQPPCSCSRSAAEWCSPCWPPEPSG